MKNINPRMLSIVICLIVLNVITAAQKPSPSPTPTPERPREIVALLNDARLAAPELAVDTFLKVVESKKVIDPVWRKEIIDEALRMIDDVQYPMPMRPAYGGPNQLNDTAEYIQASAYSAKFDRLSLKGRVITLLLETDRDRARQMVFQMGGEFGLKPRSCEDVMTYSVSDIYPVVAKVAAASFTDKQVAEGQRALLVAPWIENIESPTQIYPVLDLLQQMQGSPVEKQTLFNAFSRAINRDFKDDRSFTDSLKWGIAEKIGKLIAGDSDPLKSEIISAYRSMLLKNLRGSRCTDNEIKKDEPLPDYIEAANKLMPEKPLTYEDVIASELKGTVKITHLLAKSSAFRKLGEELRSVKGMTVVDNKIVNHDLTDAEWVSRVTAFTDRVVAFEGTDNETEGEMFFLKSALLGALIEAVNPSELRKSILRKYVRQLAGSPLQKTSFIEWWLWIHEVQRLGPESFYEMASEFPNPNFKVMLAANKLLAEPKKEAPKTTPTPERPREIVALLNDARLAAPELAVDTFLKVVESKKVIDPVWRKEIIDEALRMIDDVQYPMPMLPAYGGTVESNNLLNDTEAIVLAEAYSAKLDRLSFKGRVITLLLETDRERAKQMIFQMGGDFGLKPRSCEDALTYSPADIYLVVGKVANAVFTEQQIAEGQRALFVAPWIENIESPRQIYPALELVQQMQGSAAERQMLFNVASKAINRNFKDDRSFTYRWESIAAKIGKLVDGEADPLKSDLTNAFRGMLLKNLRGTRCKDNEIKKDEPLPDYIDAANKLFPEKPLTYEDVSTSDFSGTAKLTHILKKSSAAQKFRAELLVVVGDQLIDNKVVNHDFTDVAWVSRVNDFIDRALSFEGTDNETEGELLFLKAAFVGRMISGINPGELRKSVVRKYIRLVAGSRLQKTSFIEWRFWIADTERMAPESFYEIAAEFPNPNLKVMAAANKLLAVPKKEAPKPAPTQITKP